MELTKKLFFLFVLSVIILSCTEKKSDTVDDEYIKLKKFYPQNTMKETLKEMLKYNLEIGEVVLFIDKVAYRTKHKDEILNTIEVVEVDSIPQKDIVLVFYRYSIGAEIVRESNYMKMMENKWYIHDVYYSSYDDDPFKNKKGEEGKMILKKAEEWRKSNEDIWWK